jgi:putative inorganic carbon (HCO3(-)) transporter
VQGLTDTIFFRPEVQLIALFSLATLAASVHGAGASLLESRRP